MAKNRPDIPEDLEWNLSDAELARHWKCDPKTIRERRKKNQRTMDVVPSNAFVKGVSTLIDSDGNVKQQWVKVDKEKEDRLKMVLDAASRIADELRGEKEPVAMPTVGSPTTDLECVIPWGDSHIGQLSWPAECGDDWNLEIAERSHVQSVRHLVSIAPSAPKCHIIPVGDLVHSNDQSSVTPKSKNPLDVDSRFPKILEVTYKTLRYCIDLALTKFREVEVTILRGNHDPDSSMAISMILGALYETEPRVKVCESPAKFKKIVIGNTLLGLVHGDTRKMSDLNGIMPGLWPEEWGATKHHHWYTGHVHHDRLIDLNDGSTAESIRTLAGKDAHSASYGYNSPRDMKLDIYHLKYGRIARHNVGMLMLEDM